MATFASLFLHPVHGAAQWLVVPVATSPSELERARAAAHDVEIALPTIGEARLSGEHSSTEASSSREFAPVADELLARLGSANETLLSNVARGSSQEVIDTGSTLLAEVEPHVVAVNRRPHSARLLTDLCLYLVRAEIQLHHDAAALERAQHCLRLEPHLWQEPDAGEARRRHFLHPPEVHEMLERARDSASGSLTIQVSALDPDGCTIRVQGLPLGRTPRARLRLAVGQYAIQVECFDDAIGRIWGALVASQETTVISVEALFSNALVEDESQAPSLVYLGGNGIENLREHLAHLARFSGARRILAIIANHEGTFVRAFEVATATDTVRPIGSARLSEPFDRSARHASRTAINGGHEADESVSQPATSNPDVGVTVLGGSLLVVGLAGLGVSWYLWTEIDARGQEVSRAQISNEFNERQRAFNDAQLPVILTGTIAGALSTVGLPLLLSNEDDVPWWSWIVGAAGLGVGAFGIYELVADPGTCYPNETFRASCAKRSPTPILGALILEHAAPLIAVPITHLIGAASRMGGSTQVSVRLEPTRSGISVSGTF